MIPHINNSRDIGMHNPMIHDTFGVYVDVTY